MSDYPNLPADFGKLSIEPDPYFKPLTADDLKGFSDEDWKAIAKSEAARFRAAIADDVFEASEKILEEQEPA